MQGLKTISRNRQLTRVLTTATDSLTPDRIASLTPPGITYNQQIRLTYTTTPDMGNETPEGDHTFRVSFSYDPFKVSVLHTRSTQGGPEGFLTSHRKYADATPLGVPFFTQEAHRYHTLRVSLLHTTNKQVRHL